MQTFKDWLEVHCPEPRSQETYIRGVTGFLGWMADVQPSAKKLTEYLLWCRSKGLKPTTERCYANAIKKYFAFLQIPWEDGYCPPRMGLRLPKALSPDQVKRLFNRARQECRNMLGRRNLAMLQILYSCGLRRSELASLTINDVFFEQKHILVSNGKGKKDRLVPFDHETDSALRAWLKDRGRPNHMMLWISKKGNPIGQDAIYWALRSLAVRAGIQHWHPHQMRHTYATFLLNAGCNLRVVQELLGHASISATQVYTHVSVEQMRKEYAKFHPPKIWQ